MSNLNIFPSHRLTALSERDTVQVLFRRGSIFPTAQISSREVLRAIYLSDAAITQYSLYDLKGDIAPAQFRLKECSLPLLTDLEAKIDWLFIDWDFKTPDSAITWDDPKKGHTTAEVESFVIAHPILSRCYCWYFSNTGVRFIFQLSSPFLLKTTEEVATWKASYTQFVTSLGEPLPNSKFEDRGSPFNLSRPPHYRHEQVDTRQRKMMFPPDSEPLELEIITPPPTVSKKDQFEGIDLPPDLVKEALWHEPFIAALRHHRPALSYTDWRAIGTNIYALLGENGEEIFDEISSWDANYDSGSVSSTWRGIEKSAEVYGPVRWEQFDIAYRQAYPEDEAPHEKSSLAAGIFRKISREQSAENPTYHNAKEVYGLLSTKIVKKDGEKVEVPQRDIRNLDIILNEDNRWAKRFTRNHLGSIDLLNDERIEDEHYTEIRKSILESYGLSFSKDDISDVVRYICWNNEFHPVFNYLMKLDPWDGVDRFSLCAKLLGQTDPHAALLLRKFFISAVVRPLEWANLSPNVNWKIDTVLILKGPQGHKKSSFFRNIVPDPALFSDSLPDIQKERKDASIHMIGKWIVEQAEFEGHVARSSVECMKAFITREAEDFRRPYGRTEKRMRRPSILVGTTNSETFLNDPTGDRRFWVLSLPQSLEINLRWVRQNRDQLWAQAKALYERGEIWWLTSKEENINHRHNEPYRRLESFKELIEEYFESDPKITDLSIHPDFDGCKAFTMRSLTGFAFEKKLIDLTPALIQKISLYLVQRGWKRCLVRDRGGKGSRFWCYRKQKDNEHGENTESG